MNSKPTNPIAENPSLQQYFSTLPKMIQESIMQSNLEFQNEEDLRRCVDNMLREK